MTETVRVPLLLHSLSDLRDFWLPCLELAGVRSVTEVGAETGVTTRLLAEWLGERGGGRLVTIDPGAPGLRPDETPAGVEAVLERQLSPQALTLSQPTDAYLLDGDHNYSVLSRELAAIEAHTSGRPFPLVLLHDVGWPCARRDMYYDVAALPPDEVHPFSADGAVKPDHPNLSPGGFRGAGEFAVAVEEGGARNGLLTAVEDFLSARRHLGHQIIEAVFGLGVMVDDRQPWAKDVIAFLAPYTRNPFFARQERNRIDLYIRVLELQDRIAVLDQEGRALHMALNATRARERHDALLRASDAAHLEATDTGAP